MGKRSVATDDLSEACAQERRYADRDDHRGDGGRTARGHRCGGGRVCAARSWVAPGQCHSNARSPSCAGCCGCSHRAGSRDQPTGRPHVRGAQPEGSDIVSASLSLAGDAVTSGSGTPAVSAAPGFTRRLLKRPLAICCLVYLAVVVLVAVIAPIVLPNVAGQNAGNLLAVRQGPSLQHLLGTDDLGRDILQRLLVGTRITIA